jgi:hypothetical protein
MYADKGVTVVEPVETTVHCRFRTLSPPKCPLCLCRMRIVAVHVSFTFA